MKHLTIILFIITFFSFEVISQSRQKLYTINVYGNGAGGGDSCMRAVNEKYGFKLEGGGCRPIHRKIRGNKKKLLLLDKQNGTGWREKYKTEFRACQKEYELFIWFEREYYTRLPHGI